MTHTRYMVAIPLFENGVSPRCEYASSMLVLEMADGGEISRSVLNLSKLDPLQKMNFIAEHGFDEIVCTGISAFWKRMLIANHIRIRQTMSFDVNRVIERIRSDFRSNSKVPARIN